MSPSNHGGEADRARHTPFHQRSGNGRGFGDQREVTGLREVRGDAGIEPCMWCDHTQAVRAQDAQAMLARHRFHLFRQRARAFAQVRGEDDRGLHAAFGGGAHHLRHDRRRCGDDDQVRYPVQILQPLDRADAIDLGMPRVDPGHLAGEAGATQVAHHRAPGRTLTWTAADHRDRLRTKHGLQVVGTHAPTVPKKGDGGD